MNIHPPLRQRYAAYPFREPEPEPDQAEIANLLTLWTIAIAEGWNKTPEGDQLRERVAGLLDAEIPDAP